MEDTEILESLLPETETETEQKNEGSNGVLEYLKTVFGDEENVSGSVSTSETQVAVTESDILLELQVTNNLIGFMCALQVFFMGLMFCVGIYKIIKYNVTNYI